MIKVLLDTEQKRSKQSVIDVNYRVFKYQARLCKIQVFFKDFPLVFKYNKFMKKKMIYMLEFYYPNFS